MTKQQIRIQKILQVKVPKVTINSNYSTRHLTSLPIVEIRRLGQLSAIGIR